MSYTVVQKHEGQLTSRIGPNALGKFYDAISIEVCGRVILIGMEIQGNRVSIADEIFWNPDAPVGDELSAIAGVMRSAGKSPGLVITPYALTSFGGKVKYTDLFNQVDKIDFVAIDPYVLDIPNVTDEMLLEFSQICINYARSVGKPIILILQGFAYPGLEQRVMEYNMKLVQLDFDTLYVGDSIDWTDIPDEWLIDSSAATSFFNSRKKETSAKRISFFERVVLFFKKLFSKIF